MKQIITNWSNIVLIPIIVVMIVVLGVIAELSKAVHNVTSLPFFSSVMIAVGLLFVLVLAAVSIYKFLRNLLVFLVKGLLPDDNDNPETD